MLDHVLADDGELLEGVLHQHHRAQAQDEDDPEHEGHGLAALAACRPHAQVARRAGAQQSVPKSHEPGHPTDALYSGDRKYARDW